MFATLLELKSRDVRIPWTRVSFKMRPPLFWTSAALLPPAPPWRRQNNGRIPQKSRGACRAQAQPVGSSRNWTWRQSGETPGLLLSRFFPTNSGRRNRRIAQHRYSVNACSSYTLHYGYMERHGQTMPLSTVECPKLRPQHGSNRFLSLASGLFPFWWLIAGGHIQR